MSSRSARARRLIGALLSAPAVIPILVAAYIAIGSALVITDYALNDEGLLTYYWASWARQEFIPVFFFQRIRPVVAALYLPASAFGVHATLIVHVAVASLSIPLLAATARALGHRLPNLPALAVAMSPLYFYGGPAGFSNVDGVVGICLVLYLLTARWPVIAGMVAGALPWVRPELIIFSAAIALYGLFSARDRRLLAGMPAFPLIYASTGALYHHDPLWVLHFPPSMPLEPGYLMWQGQLEGARYILEPLLAVTALAPVIAAVRPLRLPAIELTLIGFSVAAVTLINVLPLFRLVNFGTSPRYSMLVLPALALLAGRVFESWWEGERPAFAALAAVLAFAVWLATRQPDATAVGVVVLAYVIVVAAVLLRSGTTAVAVAVALMAVEIVLPIRRDVGRSTMAAYLDPMAEWLSAHPDQITGPVLTNSQLLAAFLQSRMPGLDVRFVAWNDIVRDLMGLSNPANGQRDRIRHLCDTDLYGRMQFGPIAPEDVPPNALLALRAEDIRLPRLLPEAAWRSRLEVLEATPRIRIARVLPATEGVPSR